jgi:hypothetical protein
MRSKVIILSMLALGVISKISNAPYFYNNSRPLVLAHRGACG